MKYDWEFWPIILLSAGILFITISMVKDSCAGEFHFDAGAGVKLTKAPWGEMDFPGRGPTAILRASYEFNEGPAWKPHTIEYEHISHWFDGPPLNDNYEGHYDGVHIMWRLW